MNIQAPFIPLERFIDQNIEVILDQLLMESEMEETEFVSLDEETAKKHVLSLSLRTSSLSMVVN